MSKTAVIVALLLAVGLGIAALLLTRGNAAPPPAGPLLTLSPSEVTEVRIDLPDGSSQAVRRSGGDWRVVLASPGKPERSWPAAQTQVHAALRILSNLMPEQPAEGKVDLVAGVLTVTSGEAVQTLKVGQQRLAGRVLVESSRAAWVDANIAEMLVATGIKAWRDPAAFPGLGTGASSIEMSGQSGSRLVLAKTEGKWGIISPLRDAADAEAVSRLFALLSAARIVDFCDAGLPSVTGLDKPVATLTLADRGSGGASWSIRVGAAADIAQKSVVADIEHTRGAAKFRETVIVAGEHLAAITVDAMRYISKQALRAETGDIGNITIVSPATQSPCKRGEYRRTLEGWESRCDGGDWMPALKADVQALEKLIELCAVTAAERVELRGKREPTGEQVGIEIGTAGGAPLGGFSILINGTQLTIMTDQVFRDYAAGVGKEVAEWLGRR